VTGDRYGRTVGRVYVDGRDMNAGLVRAGYAWIYQKYATDRSLYRVEAEAKAAQRRLWALPETQKAPPWEWRHGGKQPAQAAPAQRRGRLRLKAILPRDGVV
jgi:endonuclease YncB( thermonuclease family)